MQAGDGWRAVPVAAADVQVAARGGRGHLGPDVANALALGPEDPPTVLSDVELRALLKACEGSDFAARRDTAILRVFIDTGARLSEVANLKMDSVDLDDQTLTVLGKGARVRVLPIGAKTVKAVDRYLRVRRSDLSELWIGAKGPITPSGVAQMLRGRASQAGVGHIHPHQFRHTFAHRWLAAEGRGRPPGDRGLAFARHASTLRRELPSRTRAGGSQAARAGG